MKKLLILILLALSLIGCSPELTQYNSLSRAVIAGCETRTLKSTFIQEGDIITFTANCTKEK